MSLSAKKLGLVVISALFILSCRKKENIGLQLQPQNTAGVYYSDTLTVQTRVELKNDSIFTDNTKYLIVGAYQDPVFGNLTATAYTQLHMQTLVDNNITAGNFTIDTVMAVFAYDSIPINPYWYGDTTKSKDLRLYELTEDLHVGTRYKSTSTLPGNPVGMEAFDSVQVPSKYHHTIYCKTSLGAKLLQAASHSTDQTDSTFAKYFKGLVIAPSIPDGAVRAINLGNPADLSDNPTYIRIVYRNANNERKFFFFFINTWNARFSNISVDPNSLPAGSPLRKLSKAGDTADAGRSVYVQELVGIRTRVYFPTVGGLREKLGNLNINTAELIMDLDTMPHYTPVPWVEFVMLNSNGGIRKYIYNGDTLAWHIVPDLVSGNSIAVIPGTKSYGASISNYFHNLVYGTEANNGFVIEPAVLDNNISVHRAYAPEAKMRLYYTLAK